MHLTDEAHKIFEGVPEEIDFPLSARHTIDLPKDRGIYIGEPVNTEVFTHYLLNAETTLAVSGRSTSITTFRGDYGFLSNFHSAPVVLDGVTYPTVENAFQAAKTFDAHAREAFVTTSPTEAQRLGYKVPLRSDWEEAKVPVMQLLLSRKFAPDTYLSQKLLDTGDALICEGNTWHDNFWGDCQCVKCQNKVGKNILGQLLMAQRERLRREVERG